ITLPPSSLTAASTPACTPAPEQRAITWRPSRRSRKVFFSIVFSVPGFTGKWREPISALGLGTGLYPSGQGLGGVVGGGLLPRADEEQLAVRHDLPEHSVTSQHSNHGRGGEDSRPQPLDVL